MVREMIVDSHESEVLDADRREAPYTCQYCGRPSWLEPNDQTPPPDYCHESDHGSPDDE